MTQPLSATTPERPIKIGLLGSGISGTRTPRMHLYAAEALDLPYSYDLIDATVRDLPEDPAEILSMLEAEGYDGLNVTYPFKRAVMGVLDEVSDSARKVGAVNTVLLKGGQRKGHNTDHWGFTESLRRGLPDAKKGQVLQLGAGGAGGAVAHALLDDGVGQLMIRDVGEGTAEALAARLCDTYGAGRARAVGDVMDVAGQVDGIVNCTPVGMDKHPGLPLSAAAIDPRQWVADIVYFPLETELLATARALGCAVLPGSGMALYQAVRAFKLFTGQEPDIDRMREAFASFD
ncbi:MAG: shikimate dehydrogenase [Rhodobacteraceae bacterium]|nr:shikimate dehydrogenase [Paracoccaceae bacterium]MAY45368.1 shikimate dehydrogenase [Paracoccaceae bacterium]QEW23263.1 Quinate/shikimate dehydrogenase [Paracoccaceae bacterium]